MVASRFALLTCAVLALVPVVGHAQSKGAHAIDPTADVHPSVILEGKVTIGAFTKIGAGTVITGNVTIGHHSLIQCNVTIRGRNEIGNYTHIYDVVNIEGGRPKAPLGTSTAPEAEEAIIGDYCWVNHGAVMHGTHLEDEAAVGGNTFCDYGTRVRRGAILGNGSATNVGQEIPPNCLARGVPAEIVQENLTDQDRISYFGLLPKGWGQASGQWAEERGGY